ncbi:MAG: hypothetical protein KAS63_09825 [Candidatus Heimdallarchaeota archaeon]|nr:hypothetical protein [Candidatus Heimdallarchaeota archaeon]MCK4955649.1 hypothetical protein [Candidatus Heimdallarchaeota archaeon]
MKCPKCGKFIDEIRSDYFYCKACNLLYWFLIPGAKPKVFVMNKDKVG